MRKIKLFSLLVIVVSVIILGIYMGKQAFKMLEERSLPSNQSASATTGLSSAVIKENPPSGSQQQLLYSANSPAGVNDPSLPIATHPGSLNNAPLAQGIGDSNIHSPIASGPVSGGEKWLAYAIGDGVNVREDASIKSKKLFVVSKGTRGTILEEKNDWSKIKWDFNRKIGWTRHDVLVRGPKEVMTNLMDAKGNIASISTSSVQAATKKALAIAQTVSVAVAKPAPPSETVKGYITGGKLPKEATITKDAAKIRAAPNTKAQLLGQVPKGIVVKIKSCKQIGKYQWFEIIYNNGKKEGWTRDDNLQF